MVEHDTEITIPAALKNHTVHGQSTQPQSNPLNATRTTSIAPVNPFQINWEIKNWQYKFSKKEESCDPDEKSEAKSFSFRRGEVCGDSHHSLPLNCIESSNP